jgi:hypothetical protein
VVGIGFDHLAFVFIPVARANLNVRFVPKADIGTNSVCQLFDHLVRTGEQRRLQGEAKRLCGPRALRER